MRDGFSDSFSKVTIQSFLLRSRQDFHRSASEQVHGESSDAIWSYNIAFLYHIGKRVRAQSGNMAMFPTLLIDKKLCSRFCKYMTNRNYALVYVKE